MKEKGTHTVHPSLTIKCSDNSHNRALHVQVGPLNKRTPQRDSTWTGFVEPKPPLTHITSQAQASRHHAGNTDPRCSSTTSSSPGYVRLRARPPALSHSGPWTATHRRGLGRLITSDLNVPRPK